jgi:hypothetical protein
MSKSPSTRKSRPLKETNGAVASASTSTKEAISSSASPSTDNLPARQTDGAYVPITGPIRSVRDLMRGPNMAKGSIGTFTTLAAYTEHLRGLTQGQLHLHAVEEARVTPIDDRDRLIRRLEKNWTEVAARELNAQGRSHIPQRQPMSAEQVKAQEELRRKMLGGRV